MSATGRELPLRRRHRVRQLYHVRHPGPVSQLAANLGRMLSH